MINLKDIFVIGTTIFCMFSSVYSMKEKNLDNHLKHLSTLQLDGIKIKQVMKNFNGYLILQSSNEDLFKLSKEKILKDEDNNDESDEQKIEGILKLPKPKVPLLCTSQNGMFSLLLSRQTGNSQTLSLFNHKTEKIIKTFRFGFICNTWKINNLGTLITDFGLFEQTGEHGVCIFNVKNLPDINLNQLPTATSSSFVKLIYGMGKFTSFAAHGLVKLGSDLFKKATKTEGVFLYGQDAVRDSQACSASTFGNTEYFIYALNDGSLEFHADINGEKRLWFNVDQIHEAPIKNITFNESDKYVLSYADDKTICVTNGKILYKTTLKENLVTLYWGKIKGFSEEVIVNVFLKKSENSKNDNSDDEKEEIVDSTVEFLYFMTPEDKAREQMLAWKKKNLNFDLNIMYK